MPTTVSPLVLALRALTDPLTARGLAEILGCGKTTAAELESDLMGDEPTTRRWNGEHFERLCAWEAATYGTATIADALRGKAPSEGGPDLQQMLKLAEAVSTAGAALQAIGEAAKDGMLEKAEARTLLAQIPEAVRALLRVERMARRVVEG
jgi:hypothetical protein